MRRVFSLSLVLALGCGDDGDDGGSSATSGPATTTTTAGSGTTTTSGGTTTTTTTSDGSTGGSAGSTGGGMGTVLQNDSWTPADGLTWQSWPSPDDCWASVYDIPPAAYPFDIVEVQAVIGGMNGTETFRVAVWDVDGSGMPTAEISGADVSIEGNAPSIPIIDLAASGITVPTITQGTFAVVMCHTGHMGQPTIATDADGTVDATRNWVFQDIMGSWQAAPDFFGIDGDFIVRAVIQPG